VVEPVRCRVHDPSAGAANVQRRFRACHGGNGEPAARGMRQACANLVCAYGEHVYEAKCALRGQQRPPRVRVRATVEMVLPVRVTGTACEGAMRQT